MCALIPRFITVQCLEWSNHFFYPESILSFCLLECQYWNLTVVIFVRDSAYKIAHGHLGKKKKKEKEIFDQKQTLSSYLLGVNVIIVKVITLMFDSIGHWGRDQNSFDLINA